MKLRGKKGIEQLSSAGRKRKRIWNYELGITIEKRETEKVREKPEEGNPPTASSASLRASARDDGEQKSEDVEEYLQ